MGRIRSQAIAWAVHLPVGNLHRKVRARVEHTFARTKSWKILRVCRLKGDCVHHAMPDIARPHNLTLTLTG